MKNQFIIPSFFNCMLFLTWIVTWEFSYLGMHDLHTHEYDLYTCR